MNKITARHMVLYPDIIKYMLYSTIKDKSEAHCTNYTGQRVSGRQPGLSHRALEAKGAVVS